jgi:hypothetical protein
MSTPTGGKYKAHILKEVIRRVVQNKDVTRDPDALFVKIDAPKTIVLAITTVDVSASPTLFRTYDKHPAWVNCKIWEIARATSAAYSYFESIKCGRDNIEFMDAGFGHNNPCDELVKEAKLLFPGRPIGCILSIGTGLDRAVKASSTVSVAKALVKMATSSKNVHRQMQASEYKDQYYRLEEDVAASDIQMDDFRQIGKLAGLTMNYLKQDETETQINSCVRDILSSKRKAMDGA